MQCPRCGTDQSGKFCGNCGFQLSTLNVQPSSTTFQQITSPSMNEYPSPEEELTQIEAELRVQDPTCMSAACLNLLQRRYKILDSSGFMSYEADSLPWQERRIYSLHSADWRVLSELNTQSKKDIIVDEQITLLYDTSAIRIRDHHIVELCLTAYSLPESVEDLLFLEKLRLEYYANFTLPATIGKLQNLKSLHIIEGSLRTLPEEIGQLQHLEELVLNSLPLETLPSSLYTLVNLKKFEMHHSNPITFDDNWVRSLKDKGCQFHIA